MASLRARSALVTGANRGIGLELVRQLLANQLDPPQWIFACSREPGGERGQELRKLAASHPNLIVVKLNITDLSSIKEAATVVQTHLKGAGLNLLINNAAIYTETSLETTGFDDMISVYTTNVVGPLMAFLPLLRKAAHNSNQKGLSCSKAALINISSSLGSIELVPQTYIKAVIPYRCSKAALNMLTKCEALSYKEEGILCSAVHPGWVKTDMGTQQADLTVEESVQGILEVLSRLNDEHSGAFVNWKGKKLPW